MSKDLKQLEEEIKNILNENDAKIEYQISFPQYRQYPEEVSLALKILSKHGMKITISIKKNK